MKLQSIIYPLLVPLLIGCNTGEQGTSPDNIETEQVTIYRDAYGTPQIVADSNAGVYFGYGYAVASDRLFQMEMLKRTAEGRVAEVLGQEFVELDIQLRTSYDHRSITRQLETLPPAQLEILEAYAKGFNARIDELTSELIPVEFNDYGFLPEHWNAYDVAMIFVGSIAHRYSDFNSERDNLELLQALEKRHDKATAWRIFNASKWLLDEDSPTTVPGVPGALPTQERPEYLDQLTQTNATSRVVLNEDGRFIGTTNTVEQREASRARFAAQGFSHGPEFTGASNYWAAQDLEDAAAALVNGPQFGFGIPSYVYGIGLHGGDFNVVGSTLLALPALLFAHNDNIAWGSTAGISDQSDEFLLALDPNNPQRYRHDNAWRELDVWQELVSVKGAAPLTVTARRSVHGMVQLYQPEKNIAWARARSWEGHELATLMSWIFLATDTNLEDAHQRIAAMATNINMYTMDKKGNLAYVHSGRYPSRAEGHDSRLPAVGSGRWDWRGMRPYTDNPTVRNPQQGYIANWNNRPAADWISSDLWTYTWSRADRAQLIFDALEHDPQQSQPRANIATIWDINRKISFADVNAPFLLPYLYSAWEGQQQTAQVAGTLQALRSWDQQWLIDKDGHYGPQQTLMESWLKGLLRNVIQDDIGEEYFYLYAATNYPNSPQGASMGTSPGIKVLVRNLDRLASGKWHEADYDFFNGRDAAVVLRESFLSAIESLQKEQGPEFSGWQLAAAPMQWQPYNFRGVPQARENAGLSLPAYMNRGSENNLFVATGKGILAWDVNPPGQSGFEAPDGKRVQNTANQLQLYADFGYKEVPFSLQQIRASAVSTHTLLLKQEPLKHSKKPAKEATFTMKSTATLQKNLSAGTLSSLSLVEQSLANIEELSELNAFITIDSAGALRRARELDELRKNGTPLGALHGIPMSVKDNIHVAGLPNTAGTLAFKNFIPSRDAGVIKRLKEAGAVIVGKNNMHELAYGITSNNYAFGAVRNAYNADYIAGGSSGGTAVAIASGMVSCGLGTDTGGSTRIPAALNGIVGFRPTTGRYPSDGLTPLSNTRDTVGPMANSVADVALLDSILSGETLPDTAIELSGLRLGVSRSYFFQNLEPAVSAQTERLLSALKQAGVELVETDLANLAEMNEAIGFPIVLYETGQLLEEYAAENLPGGSLQSITESIVSPDVKEVMASVLEGVITKSVYLDALHKHRPKLQQAYRDYFSENKLDAMIFPTLPLTARPIDSSLNTVELNGEQLPTFPTYIRNTDPSSNAGIPGLTIPLGRSSEGMHIGIEIDGPQGSDQRLLAIGIAIEALIKQQLSY